MPDVPAQMLLRLKNFGASAALVAITCTIYALAPYNRKQLDSWYGPPGWSFTGNEFLVTAALVYIAALAVYFAVEAEPRGSKSLHCFGALAAFARAPAATWRAGLTPPQRLALRVTLLKAFFGPMMTVSLMDFCTSAVVNGIAITASGAFDAGFRLLFDRHGFWFAMQAILFVDVLIFTVGYLVESPRLGNEIRSVDPTWLGWAVALVCYPPFNFVTVKILGSYKSDFPTFDEPTLHLAMNLLLLVLMAVYASASVALGLKASNLTHRGIVARGPYALIRHPAYVCKNLAWWIGAAPLVAASFAQSVVAGAAAIASMAGWSLIYVLRALTEEDHLRQVDAEYAAYAAKVRYRFVPGLI